MSVKLASALVPPSMTTTQRDAIPSGRRPPGSVVFNTTTNQLEINSGSDATPAWTSTNTWHIGSTPPSSPSNGDTWMYNGATGIWWMFVYDNTEATYKWKFVGGSPYGVGPTGATTGSPTTWTAIGAIGSYSFPRSGYYEINFGSVELGNNGTWSSSYDVYLQCDYGGSKGTAAAFSASAVWAAGAVHSRERTGATTAGTILQLGWFCQSAQSSRVGNAWLTVLPVQVS